MNRRSLITLCLAAAALVWAGTVAAAFEAIRRFESTPGEAATAPVSWPAKSSIHRKGEEWTLVMLVHPHCSCSRASISELQAVIEKSPASLQPYVLVYRPSDAKPGWEKTDVFESATRLRRVHVLIDADGREADTFGGFTSGQTFLYDGKGKLRFEGGITLLRGHAGLNRGRADLIQITSAGQGNGSHPVFGCAISSPERKSR